MNVEEMSKHIAVAIHKMASTGIVIQGLEKKTDDKQKLRIGMEGTMDALEQLYKSAYDAGFTAGTSYGEFQYAQKN